MLIMPTSLPLATPVPLAARKTLPHPIMTSMISLKRGTPADMADPPTKRAKRDLSPPSTPDPAQRLTFKIPLMPTCTRALTPSTSTVAFSSSPRPDIASSSPPPSTLKRKKRIPIALDHEITLPKGHTLIFGRHRHRPALLNLATSDEMTSLNTAVPHHLSHLLDRPHDHARTIHLSRHAAHASRVHAVVESLSGDALRVVVVGQNGLRLVCEGRSRRLVQGQRADVCREVGYVELDFYGSRVRVAFQGEEEAEEKEEEEEGRERLFTPPPPSAREGMLSPVSPVSSMPPSSPPLALEALDEEARSRGSSPLSAASEDEHEPEDEDEVPHDPETQNATAINDLAEKEPDAKEIKAEHLDTLPRSTTPPTAKPNTLPPESIDLTALLASTVVFSGSSKLSLPDLVKHMLESQPSLRKHGDESQWTEWAGTELEGNPTFGIVKRHGKDSSGRPLLPHYFYNPDLDPDVARAAQLGGLVRPLRTVQRGGGKAIDWRPVGSGRRRY